MPRTLVRAPGHDRARSLGWLAVAWLEHFVRHGPGDVQGQQLHHGDEMTGFIVDCYALGDAPGNAHMLYDSVFLSRPKGCDKSGLAGRLALLEGLGPCRFAGWARGGETYRDPWGFGFEYTYEPGEPMGQPVTAPYIRIMATEEQQSANVYDTIFYNLTDEDCPLSQVPGIDPGLTRVNLPHGGQIMPSTASSSSKDGGKETYIALDESHLMNTPELHRMYDTVTRNLRKRKGTAGTWFMETTTMFSPGENSVAEKTFAEAEALRAGRKKRGRHRLLYDHRWGECKNLADEAELRAALRDAYGEAIAWQDLDGFVDQFYDTRTDPTNARRFFLNAQTSSSDAWISAVEWNACGRPDRSLKDKDLVTLGMDGSVKEDATALVAVRVHDGHMELLGCWEKPPGALGDDWQVDREAVDAAVANAMHRFEVVGMYADPHHWQDYLDRWNNEFGAQMRVRASDRRPLEWWTSRPRAMVAALERFHEAVLEERISFTPQADRVGREAELAATLTRHVLNARRRPSRAGLQIGKDRPHSERRIDSAVAAVLAYEAASEAIAQGVKAAVPATTYVAKRLR